MKKKILLMMTSCLLWLLNYSQNGSSLTIGGKIANEKDQALAGASIRVKGTSTGVIADQSGKFKITVAFLPATLLVSHTNFQEQEIIAENGNEISVKLMPTSILLEGVVMVSKGIPTRIIDALYPAEYMGHAAIRQLPTTSAYNGLAAKKGVGFTTSSLTFNTPSARGHNGSGSTRVNQIVDGMDNQAPGLNFFVGNFTGLTELDIESIELLPGASSALYGPGGMNGTILMNSKSPFNAKFQGLSFIAKPGIMHVGKTNRSGSSAYHDYSLRWAKSFKDKFAIKLGAQYISADDWLASDTSNYLRSGTSGKLIPGTRASDPNYDGVNVYGDETNTNILGVAQAVQEAYRLGINSGSGGAIPNIVALLNGAIPNGATYSDAINIVNAIFTGPLDPLKPTVRDGLLPFYWGLRNNLVPNMLVSRTGYHEKDVVDPQTKNIKLSGALHYKLTDKIEAILMGYWATGNTVYTDDNRYALKGIKIGQYKLELKHKNWFIRSYTTQEDAGEAYSATIATQYLNEAWKKSQQWYPEYVGAYLGAIYMGANSAQSHTAARGYADIGRPEAGSTQFNQLFDQVRKTPIPDGGLFKEKSQLWMTEGQYTFGDAEKNAEVIVGGNYKRYVLNSGGTLFIDSLEAISINEFGGYAQVTRKLFSNKLTLSGSGRFDKNENFKAQFTPRFAALINVAKDNNIRMSYQTAYRFPGNLSQWIRLDVGGDYLLLGGLPWVMDYMQAAKYPVYEIGGPSTPYVYKEFKPETMRSFEFGYKGLITKKLFIDAYGYIGSYKDFIGRIGLFQPATNLAYSITVNSTNKVKTHGYGLGIDYRLGKKNNTSVFFNIYSDVITDVPSGFKAYFNSPKYRVNIGFGNSGFGKDERISFNIMFRWQDAFEYEGELANGPVSAFTTIDAQVSYKLPAIKSTFRLGGTNLLNHYYKNAYGNPSIGGLYYASYIFNL
jgi:outer membrane receptor protein involved in Fe transport